MDTFLQTLQGFVLGLPDPVQFIGVAAVGAVPFVESYGAATIGIAAGVPIALAVLAAVVGNIASVLLVVYGIASVRHRATGRGATQDATVAAAENGAGAGDGAGTRGRVAENVRRVGVPGASLLGPLLLPSQLTSAAMVGIGANRHMVFVWTSISVTVWGLAIGLAAAGVFSATGVI